MTRSLDSLAAGQSALTRADWRDAKRLFELALNKDPSPQAHDGLGLALWWLNDIRASHHQRTLAYQQYKKRGDISQAAMLAIWLAREQIFLDGNFSAMKGWFARAERLLQDLPQSIEHVWFELLRASLLASSSEMETIASQAVDAARAHHDENLEATALAFCGIARVSQGRVSEGMNDLDEAMSAATGGEIALPWVSEIFCLMLSACDLSGDLGRTEEWCRTAQTYAEQNHFPFLAATCRVTYGSLLTATGQWDIAETELVNAIQAFESGHVALRTQAVIKLADLRVWQGRLEEAAVLLAGFEDQDAAALPMARLALARGDKELAHAILVQAIPSNAPLTIDKAPLLRLLVDVDLELAHIEAARISAARLTELAHASNSTLLHAQAELAQGQILRFEHSPEAAQFFQAALARLHNYDQSLLAARARLEMAQLTRDTDRPAAITWARAASASFERMGAKYDAAQAATLLRQLGAPPSNPTRAQDTLTPREHEVLQLLGKGLTNREIGVRLVVSPKTVEHHVSQILAKLGARSRAEAAAMAARS
jgi:DNA-binding NarL/FixJ family response regulator